MSQMTSPDEIEHVDAHTVYEGDRVFMGIHYHNSDNTEECEYKEDIHQAGVEGTVIDAPGDGAREVMADGVRVLADFAVETDDGNVFRWHVDNGYVLGYHTELDRRTDIGKFGGFYK